MSTISASALPLLFRQPDRLLISEFHDQRRRTARIAEHHAWPHAMRTLGLAAQRGNYLPVSFEASSNSHVRHATQPRHLAGWLNPIGVGAAYDIAAGQPSRYVPPTLRPDTTVVNQPATRAMPPRALLAISAPGQPAAWPYDTPFPADTPADQPYTPHRIPSKKPRGPQAPWNTPPGDQFIDTYM